MQPKPSLKTIQKQCFNAGVFPSEVLDWIASENLWNLWVPKNYGGLEFSLTEGLRKLQFLAKIDGSLGWTITLCSGANYFIGNLDREAREAIFRSSQQPIVLGGSGGAFGTAEKEKDGYRISGKWRYATGANYLSHFTLTAKITENGKVLKNKNDKPQLRSFVVPKEKVYIIEDWNTMGLKASVTYSFEVDNEFIDGKFSFVYDEVQLSQPIFKIPFSVFADLTLWINYVGMAEHFWEEASKSLSEVQSESLNTIISSAAKSIFEFSAEIEEVTSKGVDISQKNQQKIHNTTVESVRAISRAIIEAHPFLGIKASSENKPLNQIFRDYFTATQHRIFVD